MKMLARRGGFYQKPITLLARIFVVGCVLFNAINVLAKPRTPLPLVPDFSWPLYQETFDEAYSYGSTDEQVTVGKFVFDQSWSGYALQRSGAAVTPFFVPAVDSTGHTNISCNNSAGTIRVWFEPTTWSSGAGPGAAATLLELDAIVKNQSANVWSLQVSADGTTLSLVAQSDGNQSIILQTQINWQAQQSHLLVLDYSAKETALFIDGQMAAEGTGTPAVPPQIAALFVGSSLTGESVAGGDFDELYCFGVPPTARFYRPLTADEILFYYNVYAPTAALGPISAEETAARQQAVAARRAQRSMISSMSMMSASMSSSLPTGATSGLLSFGCACNCNCATGGQVYFTNLTATLTTNQGMVVSFNLAGGTNGMAYGVFTTTNIGSPNWKWIGNAYTCSTVYLTNQPADVAFYALGAVSQTMTIAWGDDSFGESDVPDGLTNAIAVAGGGDGSPTITAAFSVALRADGKVVAWGDNTHGQTNVPAGLTNVVVISSQAHHSLALGFDGKVSAWGSWKGFNGSFSNTIVPLDLTNAIAIAAGRQHDLAVRCNGSVVAWAYDTNDDAAIVPTNLPPARDVAAGWYHSVALLTNGTVRAWGDDTFGQTDVPSNLSNVVAIATGTFHTLALKSDGTVTAWGAEADKGILIFGQILNQYEGQSDVPAGLSNVVAIAAGIYYSSALKSDGTVVMWGNGLGLPTYSFSPVASIGSGWYHALAIRKRPLTPIIVAQPTNQLVLLGSNATFSVKAFVTPGTTYQWQTNTVNLPSATNATLILTNVGLPQQATYRVNINSQDGSVTSSNATLTLILPPVITSLTQPTQQFVFYQNSQTLSVTASTPGDTSGIPITYQWQQSGTNIPGQTSSNYSFTVTASGNYSVIVSHSAFSTNASWQVQAVLPGSVLGWGADDFGQSDAPATLTNTIALAGGGHHSVAVRENGTVVAWGSNTSGQTNVPAGLSNIVAVAAGEAHTLALRSDGIVIAWGANGSGQTNVPGGLTNVVAISAGGDQSMALRNDGTVTNWGASFGSPPAGLNQVAGIASGTNFNLALLTNSTVIAWGANNYGQTNVPAGLSNVVAVAASGSHALALKQNGTLVAWGSMTNIPAGLSNVMAIAAGYAHSVALKNDGSAVAWGDNTYGQTNLAINTGVKLIAAGSYHTLVGFFSPLVQYSVNVTKDLLLLYNTNSAESVWVKDYYLAHRPMIGGANVLGIGCTTNTTTLVQDYTNQIAAPIQNWLATNPTKRPQFVILMAGIPWRVGTNDSPLGSYYPSSDYSVSVQYKISSSCLAGWTPFLTSINMGEFAVTNGVTANFAVYTNACKAYIDKLEFIGTNYSLGRLLISATSGGYGNTNYYFDDSRAISGSGFSLGHDALLGVSNVNSAASIVYTNGNDNFTNITIHITNGVNVAGYLSWGEHSALSGQYPINGKVKWNNNAKWWLIETVESFNGLPGFGQGDFFQWFSATAFGGTNYSCTPIGAVTHTDEPFLPGVENSARYFGLWEQGKSFVICAWNARNTIYFQAVGDPFATK